MDEEMINKFFAHNQTQRAMGEAHLSEALAGQMRQVRFADLDSSHLLAMLITLSGNADTLIAAISTELRQTKLRVEELERNR